MSKVPVHSRHYGRTLCDYPRDADIYQTRLRDGDIVVVYVSVCVNTSLCVGCSNSFKLVVLCVGMRVCVVAVVVIVRRTDYQTTFLRTR